MMDELCPESSAERMRLVRHKTDSPRRPWRASFLRNIPGHRVGRISSKDIAEVTEAAEKSKMHATSRRLRCPRRRV